eukprot:UN23931
MFFIPFTSNFRNVKIFLIHKYRFIIFQACIVSDHGRGQNTILDCQEGQLVNAGDVYCEVETDKASVAYEAVEEGWLAKIIIHDPEQVVQVGDAIGVMVDEEKDIVTYRMIIHFHEHVF